MVLPTGGGVAEGPFQRAFDSTAVCSRFIPAGSDTLVDFSLDGFWISHLARALLDIFSAWVTIKIVTVTPNQSVEATAAPRLQF